MTTTHPEENTMSTTPLARGDRKVITPENVEVGDGLTYRGWSDSMPFTVVAVRRNGRQIEVRADDVDDRTEWKSYPGGFCAHWEQVGPTVQTFTPGPATRPTRTLNWAPAKKHYQDAGGRRYTSGRFYHYDRNF